MLVMSTRFSVGVVVVLLLGRVKALTSSTLVIRMSLACATFPVMARAMASRNFLSLALTRAAEIPVRPMTASTSA